MQPVLDSPNEITIRTEETGANTPDDTSEVPQKATNTGVGAEETGANTPDDTREVPQQATNTGIVEIHPHQSNIYKTN